MATKKRPAPKSKKPVKKSAPAPKSKAAPAKAAKSAKAPKAKAKPAKPAKQAKTAAKKPSDDAQLASRGNGIKAPAPKQPAAISEPLEQSEASTDLVKLAKSAALKRLLRN